MGLPPLTKKTATAVYDLLMDVGGAHKNYRDHFIQHYTEADPSREWRFQGHLGFGGKFYLSYDRFRAGCYKEDSNEEREAIIAELNEKLAELFHQRDS